MSGFIKVSAKIAGSSGGFKGVLIRVADIVGAMHAGAERCTIETAIPATFAPIERVSYDCNQSVDTIADLLGAQAAPPAVTPYPQPAPTTANAGWGDPRG
jgi:hypothetical protein